MKPHLLTFGPNRTVPEGYRWCNACDGAGSDHDGRCVVCDGKGHWNEDDIARYHAKFPDVCRRSCGPDGHYDARKPTVIEKHLDAALAAIEGEPSPEKLAESNKHIDAILNLLEKRRSPKP